MSYQLFCFLLTHRAAVFWAKKYLFAFAISLWNKTIPVTYYCCCCWQKTPLLQAIQVSIIVMSSWGLLFNTPLPYLTLGQCQLGPPILGNIKDQHKSEKCWLLNHHVEYPVPVPQGNTYSNPQGKSGRREKLWACLWPWFRKTFLFRNGA